MPTSVPGTYSRRGFTLIELLVVLLIMGLLAGLVTALVRPDDRAVLRVEAERLSELFGLATLEARLTGIPIAWVADANGYRFWRLRGDTGGSAAVNEIPRDSLRPRDLPPGVVISNLRIEALRPPEGLRLEFSPHGSLAFALQMSLGTARYDIAGSPLGEVRIHESP